MCAVYDLIIGVQCTILLYHTYTACSIPSLGTIRSRDAQPGKHHSPGEYNKFTRCVYFTVGQVLVWHSGRQDNGMVLMSSRTQPVELPLLRSVLTCDNLPKVATMSPRRH